MLITIIQCERHGVRHGESISIYVALSEGQHGLHDQVREDMYSDADK